MQGSKVSNNKYLIIRIVCIIAAIAVNVTLNRITYISGIPLYLDTAGTIAASCIFGLLPGVTTAFISNLVCATFNPAAVYYSFLGILISILAVYFSQRGLFKRPLLMVAFVLLAALAGGGIGAIFQLIILGTPQFEVIRDTAEMLAPSGGSRFICAFIIMNIGLNLIDKALAAMSVMVLMWFIPKDTISKLQDVGRYQKRLSKEEINELESGGKDTRHSLLAVITTTLIFVSISITVVLAAITIRLYSDNLKGEYTKDATRAAEFAASVVDPDMVDHYILEGEEATYDLQYQETKKLLDNIHKSLQVKYLYILKIERDGCHFVFDTETEDTPAYLPGERVDFEEEFEPYLETLIEGEEIDPIESDYKGAWLLTAYAPVRNSSGKTVAYAGADVSMNYLSDFVKNYIVRVIIISSGVLALVLTFGFWTSRNRFVYPIDSMAKAAYSFTDGNKGQEELDEHVNTLKSLEIRTGDEIEKLYHAICRMAENTSEQMREIRYYADTNAKMQNGLVMTMADMVENRDSDTGAHIQKTAAYVRIILSGLKKKGYYNQKLTEKYMSDVEMSAPLHDVGKINIPDAILNKPGKLTAEEYEIMKTHTTAGKEILEKAIDTVNGGSYLKEARNMAAYHHERWDGKGYPDGLYGEVIPLSARVMAVADVFDALASPRIYKPPFTLEKALAVLEDGAGTQFDPKCVEVFMDSLAEVKQVLKMYQE